MITLLDKADLISYYCLPDFKGNEDVLTRLCSQNLLEYNSGSSRFEVSERGKALCEAIRSVPLPMQTWIVTFPPSKG